MNLTLSKEELIELTGYKQTKMQIKVLRSRGVEPIHKPDNTLAVMREWVANIGIKSTVESSQPQLKLIKK